MPFYDIECAFEHIETYFQSKEISKNKANGFCDHLKFLRKQCNLKRTENDPAFLIYCIEKKNEHTKIIKCFPKYNFDILQEDFDYIDGKYYCRK